MNDREQLKPHARERPRCNAKPEGISSGESTITGTSSRAWRGWNSMFLSLTRSELDKYLNSVGLPMRPWPNDHARTISLDPLTAATWGAAERLVDLERTARLSGFTSESALRKQDLDVLRDHTKRLEVSRRELKGALARIPNFCDQPMSGRSPLNHLDDAIRSLKEIIGSAELLSDMQSMLTIDHNLMVLCEEWGHALQRPADGTPPALPRLDELDRLKQQMNSALKTVDRAEHVHKNGQVVSDEAEPDLSPSRRTTLTALSTSLRIVPSSGYINDPTGEIDLWRQTQVRGVLGYSAGHSAGAAFIRHNLYPVFLELFETSGKPPSRRGRRGKRTAGPVPIAARSSFITFAKGFFDRIGARVSRKTIDNAMSG